MDDNRTNTSETSAVSSESKRLFDSKATFTIVSAQRGMMWLFLAKLGAEIAVPVVQDTVPTLAFSAYAIVVLVIAGAMAYFVFRIANIIYGTGPAIVCACLTLVPCVSLFTILILNGNIMDRLRKQGVSVGMMGATVEQLRDLAAACDQKSPQQCDP